MGLIDFFHSHLPEPILFTSGIFQIHWYGLSMVVGILIGFFITRLIWQRQGLETKKIDEIVIWLVVGGLVGARFLDVFVYEWWYFKNHLSEILYIWQGGLAWHGGLLGGGLVLWWWTKKEKISFWQLLDTFAPGLALGQALGRWGNYFNQELFGLPTNLPWGIPISISNRPVEFASFSHFHPTFIYESIGLAIIAYLLWRVGKKIKNHGQIFAWYLCLTGVLRFVLEYLRTDEQNIFIGWRVGWWIAGLIIILGLWLLYNRRLRNLANNKTAP